MKTNHLNKIDNIEKRLFNFGLIMLATSVAFSISIMNAVFIFLFAAFVIRFLQGEIQFIKTGLEIPLLLFMGLYFLSAFLSPEPQRSISYTIRNFWHILYMYAVIYLFTGDDIKRFVKIMAWSAVAVSIYSVFQSLLGLHTEINLRLPDKTYMMVRPRDRIAFELGGWPVRMGTGITGHHLTYGGQILMMGFFVWSAFKKKWAFALTTVSVFLSFAYSAWLGFVGAIFIYFGFRKKTAPYALALVLVFFSLLFLVPGNKDKVIRKFDDRVRIWKAAAVMYSEKPVLGIGPNQFKRNYKENFLDKYPGDLVGHSHSVYLDLLAEVGTLTFLAFFLFIGVFIKKYGRTHPGEFHGIQTACNLAFIGIAIAGIFQNYHTAAENSVLIWILFGIAVKTRLLQANPSLDD